MSDAGGRLRIGTSGYQYDHWIGILYPESLPRKRWFERYAEDFGSVEINNTFYGLPEPGVFDAWRERAPQGFVYALKFSRYGTHLKHLKEPEKTIPTFVERARRLGDHLGPVLVQIPPNWNANPDRLRAFLESTPGDLRWTVEVRDTSWLCGPVYRTLEEAGAALCIHDMLEDHPWRTTTDWVYVRYHGDGYRGGYAHQALSADADRIARYLQEGRDAYVYFNNDQKGCAIRDARRLSRYLASRVG